MLFWGQILSLSPTKPVYLAFIALFELGSLLCAVAPSMPVLIFGRAVAGMGAGGIFNAAFTVAAQVAALEQRPLLFGSAGAVFALSSILGPLVGGAFTDKVSWRWCFNINLPVGAVAVLFLLVLLPTYAAPENVHFLRFGWKKYIE
jgi:MFS family permease